MIRRYPSQAAQQQARAAPVLVNAGRVAAASDAEAVAAMVPANLQKKLDAISDRLDRVESSE